MADQFVSTVVVGDAVAAPGAWADETALLQIRLAELGEELHRASEEADRAMDTARRHAAEVQSLQFLLRQEQCHVQALLDSTSWTMTAPVRSVARAWRRRVRAPLRRWAGGALVSRSVPVADAPAPRLAPRLARHIAAAPPAFPLPGDLAAHPALCAVVPPTVAATVSVIIPTLDGGPELLWLVRKLQSQRGVGAVEIVLVDSGSTDGTPEQAAAMGCTVLPIARAQFSHSHARNLGAAASRGDLLLFMVQDAYPVGDAWLSGLAQCLLHPQPGQAAPAAVSCAEFARSDSELLYDALAHTHYEFLGCGQADRLGRLRGRGHADRRRQGQLSDVACMIPRPLFERYGFRGRYAEDLTLGVRLIEDGHQIAMLNSIRVVHSHHRPASYYLRRCFVDVVFLAAAFADFELPPANLPLGTLMGSFALQAAVPLLQPDPRVAPAVLLDHVIETLRGVQMPALGRALPRQGDFGCAPLGVWMAGLLRHAALVGRKLPAVELRAARQLQEVALARLQALRPYVAQAWPVADATAIGQLSEAIEKTLAMSLGAQLAYCHLRPSAMLDAAVRGMLEDLNPLLLAGI